MKKLVLLMALSLQLMAFAQTTIFSENFGTPSVNTLIPAYANGTAPATFQNKATHSYAGSADVRNTSQSSTYTGFSAGGNLWLAATASKDLVISKINTLNFSNITLSFGFFQTNATATIILAEYSTDSINWTNIAFTRPSSGAWALVTATTSLPADTNLKIRFRQPATGTLNSYRVDDIKITGFANTPCAISPILTTYQATNTCPNWQVNLETAFVPTNKPATSKISWHTADTAKLSNKMTNLNVDPGTYYISFYDSANNCYSATKAVTVSQTNCNQICFYNENFGTPTATTGVDTFLGYQNALPIKYSGNVDVRTTSPSNGYSSASASGNVFLTSTSLPRRLLISGINSTNYKNLQLSFGAFKSTTDTFKLIIEVGTDTNFLTPLSYTTALAQNQWAYITPSGNIPKSNNLMIRISNNSTAQFRVDDIKLCGEPICNIKPILNDTFAWNDCPDTLVNLGVYFQAQNTPAGSVLKWHTQPMANSNNVLNNLMVKGDSTSYSNLASTTNPSFFYASYYDSLNNCYSATQKIYVVKNICSTSICQVIPFLNDTTATNTCPDTTINLGVKFTAQNKPANAKLTWHTGVTATPNNKLFGLIVSGPAVYYASYYDSANNCYSATRKVYVTKTSCSSNCTPTSKWIDTVICSGQSFRGYTASGMYLDTLVNSKGCDSILTLNITVIPKTTVSISKQYNGIPTAITLTANQNPWDSFSTYKWTFKGNLIPNANSQAYYKSFTTANDTGNYCVIVTGWSGCKDTACIMAKDTFSCNIVANYRVLNNSNRVLTLQDSSLFTPNIAKTIKVYWGDGQSNTYTTVMNMVHTYAKDTFYNVCYVVKYLQFNCTDSVCKTLKINGASTTISCAQYKTFSKTVNGTNVVLNGAAVPAPYKASYNWVLSNGITKNNKTFDTILPSGSYYATLYICIKDSNNVTICCDSSSQSFNILNCNLSGVISKNGNTLTANPIGGASPFRYIWNNGDSSRTLMNVVPGQYCVTIYDANQCSSVNCFTVTNPNPNVPCTLDAKFGYVYTSSGAIQFNDSSTSNGFGMSYTWIFGDGTYSTQKNPLKTYSQNGTYNVILVVTSWINSNNQYCVDTFTSTINIVNVNPCNAFIPNFTWSQSGNTYSFINTSSLSGYTILSTQWQFSDGTTTTLNNPIKTFSTSGTKVIVLTLTVRNNQTQTTCTKTVTKYLNVNTSPCASHKAYNTFSKSGKTVTFTNTSIGTNSTTTYLYKFGNGDTSNLPSPAYTYALPGLYRTVMYVKTTFNNITCIDSFVRIVQITTSNLCKDSGYTTYYNYSCQDYTSPICGCDSVTYKNYCLASRAGVKQYTYGPCPNDTTYVTICGFVVNDINKNCQKDASDLAIPYVKITINTVPPTYAYTNTSGYFTAVVKKGTYTLTQSLNSNTNPFAYNQLCPSAGISVVATTPGQVYCNNNFYDTTSTCQDLSTSIQRAANITPGFTSMKRIKYQNNGATAVANAVLHYRFLNSLSIKTSTSSPYMVSGNVISWNIGTIPAYSSGYRNAHFITPTTLPLGTTVIDSAWIEPMTGDCNLANNSATYKDTCVGSWDPNDKAAYPAGNTDTSVKVIDYLVRFQNTGTAPAHNVVIVDSLENNLDFNTLTLHSTSHKPCRVFTNDNKKVYFEFENIMLPDSGTDYEGSQGYVNFSVKLKENLAVGTQIKNTAAIYFDFNEPVITNTTVNTIYLKSSSGIVSKEKDCTLELYPNPSKGEKVTLKVISEKMQTVSYRIFDLNGREKMTTVERKANGYYEEEIQLNSLSKGIYLIDISINGEASGKMKLVKE